MVRNVKSAPMSVAELKRRIPDVAIVARDLYGLDFRKGAARCPFPENHAHGDRDPSLRHDRKKNRLFCASQNCLGEKGVDVLGLVERMDRCSFPEAIRRLVGHYGIQTGGEELGFRRHDPPTQSEAWGGNSNDEQSIPAEKVRQDLSRQGFRVVAELQYGACLRKVSFEHESARQADKDRAEKTFRWEHLVDGAWYSGDGGFAKPLYVNRTFQERDQVGQAVGFEGEAKADLAGKFGLAAFSFKNITPEQAAALVDCDVVLWPDNDASGKEQAETAARVICDGAQSRSVKLLVPPAQFPLAADIVDAVNDFAWGRTLIVQFLETAVPYANSERCREKINTDGFTQSPPTSHPQSDDQNEWPLPEPLQSELPPVKPFHELLLPASFRPLVADLTERMQSPMDFAAAVMVLCLAGIVNRRAVIQPKSNDYGWIIVPNL